MCLLGANLFNSIALSTSGITLTYVTKASIPLWTVALLAMQMSWRRFRAETSTASLLSLLPITLGVALSAWSDSNFSLLGFAAAIASTLCQTLMNIASKEKIASSRLGGTKVQFILVLGCTLALGTASLLQAW